MKPLIKIIVLSIVAIVLIATMVIIITSNGNIGNGWINLSINSAYFYSDVDDYSVGGAELSGEVNKLDISWISGSVKIEGYEGDKIIITESASGEIEEKYKLRYIFEDGTLRVKYQKSGVFDWFKEKNIKSLTVKIPNQYLSNMDNVKFEIVNAKLDLCDITSDKVIINSVSGDVNADSIHGNDISIESVSGTIEAAMLSSKKADIKSISGEININDCEITGDFSLSSVSGGIKIVDGIIENLDIETTGGGININCHAESFDCDTVSGSVKAVFVNCPTEMDVESVSGSYVITIAENDGFTANCDSISGNFSIEGLATIKEGDNYIYKNGVNKFNFESVSGDITIRLLS